MLLMALLVFLAISLALAGLYLWLVPTQAQQRLEQMAGPAAPTAWTARAARWAQPLARLSAPTGAWQESPLRLHFLQAGIGREDARLLYFGAKTLLPLLLAGVVFAALQGSRTSTLELLLALAVAALCGSYAPNLVLALARRQRQREIFEHFPDATDLMLICMEAGLSMDSALARVEREMRLSSGALADELHLTQLELRAGVPREQALRHLALRTGVEEIATFGLMLRQAERLGTSIGDSLRVYSDELRHKRMTRAEEAAARVPTKMLLPLVLCIFPSIILVVMGPAAITVIRTLMPLLGGGS
jgi:tight adherence protein C